MSELIGWLFVIAGVVVIAYIVYDRLTQVTPGDKNLSETAGDLAGRYNTNMNPLTARRQKRHSEARQEFLKTIQQEIEVVKQVEQQQYDIYKLPERRVRQEALEKLDFQIEVATKQLTMDRMADYRQLQSQAAAEGLDLPTYLEYRQKMLYGQMELTLQVQSAIETIKLAGLYTDLVEHTRIEQLGTKLSNLYLKSYEIANGELPDEVKQRQLKANEDTIRATEKDKRDRERRLVQTAYRKKPGGTEDSDLR